MPPDNTPGDSAEFHIERLIDAPREQVWQAHTQAEHLARWWGPDGFSNTFEVFEFKPQGRWTFVMHGPDGTHYANDCIFLEASPQRLVIRHVTAPHFTLTITLAEADGHTRLDWRQAFDDPRVAAAVAPIVGPANEQNLNRLQAVLRAAV